MKRLDSMTIEDLKRIMVFSTKIILDPPSKEDLKRKF